MLRFSANISTLFTEAAFLDRICLAKAAGFHAIEIQFPYAIAASSLTEVLAEQSIELALFNLPTGDFGDGGDGLACVPGRQADFTRALTQALDYAEVVRPGCVNILAGRVPVEASRTACVDAFVSNLRDAAVAFAEIGVKTVFEALNEHDVPRYLATTSEQQREILYRVEHPNCYLQYDVYHMARMQVDYLSDLRDSDLSIAHIQFADAPGRHQPGTGEIDFSTVFRAIAERDYDGWTGAEYRPDGDTTASFGWLHPGANS